MLDTLKGEGVIFDDQLIDPHYAADNHPNRKPGTGMFGKYMGGDYDLAASYVIGDRLTDVELAYNLGAKAILITADVERIEALGKLPYSDTCVLVTNSWREISEFLRTTERAATVVRATKETSIETFVQDTITFVRVLQTLNNAQPYPPYILELDDACEVVDLLTRCWIYGEKIEADSSSRAVALFDNHKNLQEHFDCKEDAYPTFFNKHKFVGVFFNSEGMLLVRKRTDNGKALYDFAISDYVLAGEWTSLEGLQRAISNDFGFDFFFGDVAPKLTLKQNKLISDYYVIHCYDVSIEQLKHNDNYSFEWINKDTLSSLLNNGSFLYCSMNIINYLYEI
jgi:hypothetical protein